MTSYLEKILCYKHQEVAAMLAGSAVKSELCSRAEMSTKVSPPRGFVANLQQKRSNGHIGIVAEIKHSSPSRGQIAKNFDPADIARSYENGGAAAISVLTDKPSFQGDSTHLIQARNACQIPVLRKDFMVDPLQIIESRAMGADAILIILAAVSDEMAEVLALEAFKWQMDVLLETHNASEMSRAISLTKTVRAACLTDDHASEKSPNFAIGINNRSLFTFEVDLTTTETLAAEYIEAGLHKHYPLLCESGIETEADIERIANAGVTSFLIGETLMRANDRASALRTLCGQHSRISINLQGEGR